ncbi:hypothetical protein FYL98_18940, partial [Salmonella enterica subsp. enterica serovar Typhimurium]
GRGTNMMRHPERVRRTVASCWHPETWGGGRWWMSIFRNARKQLG